MAVTYQALDTGAMQLFSHFLRCGGQVTPELEAQLHPGEGAQPITQQKLEEIIQAQMPRSQALQEAKKLLGVDQRAACDCPEFKTSIIGRPKITKIENRVNPRWNPPQPRIVVRDPLEADFALDPKGQYFIFSSGSKFSPPAGNGQMRKRLLLAVAIRKEKAGDSVDPAKMSEANKARMAKAMEEAEKQYFHHKHDPQPHGIKVYWLEPNDARLDAKIVDELHFDGGSATRVVTFDKDFAERSRTHHTNPENFIETRYFRPMANDRNAPDLNQPFERAPHVNGTRPGTDITAPERDDTRIRLSMSAKATMPPGTWINDAGSAQHLDATLEVGKGWLMEGAKGNVSFLGKKIDIELTDEAALWDLGSAASKVALDTAAGNRTIKQLLEQVVTSEARRAPTEQNASSQVAAVNMLYAKAAEMKIAGQVFQPLSDITAQLGVTAGISADMRPLRDAENNGVSVNVRLAEGFLGGSANAPVKGWRIEVGYLDTTGAKPEWRADKVFTVKGNTASEAKELNIDIPSFDVARAQDRNAKRGVEIRIFNDGGVPAGRVLIPLEQLKWSADCAPGTTTR